MIKRIKPAAASVLYYSGFFELMRRWQQKRLTIVMYHRFCIGPDPFKLSADNFEKQIRFFKKKYNIISLDTINDFFLGKCNLPNNPIIITIDDGYHDNFSIAFSILKKNSAIATVFLTTDFIQFKKWIWFNKLEYILKKTPLEYFLFPLGAEEQGFAVNNFQDRHRSQMKIFKYCRGIGLSKTEMLLTELAQNLQVNVPEQVTEDYRPLSWSEIKLMQENGINFGAHTCSHPILTNLSIDEARHEVLQSKLVVEKNIGTPVTSFCYPDGKVSNSIRNLVQNCGFSNAVTTNAGFNHCKDSDLFSLNRIPISDSSAPYLSRQMTRLL